MNMPGLFGLQLLWCIRTGFEKIRHDLAVIMVTGHSETELVDRALALDVDGFLSKPVSIDALRAKIEKAVTARSGIKSIADYKKISITAIVTQFGRERKRAQPGVRNDKALLLADIVCPTTLTRPVIATNGVELVPAGTLITKPLIEYLKGLSCLPTDRLWVE
jgi:response regulator of citrate/malate metabolism